MPKDKLKTTTQDIRDLLVQIAHATANLENKQYPNRADLHDAKIIKADLQEIARFTKLRHLREERRAEC